MGKPFNDLSGKSFNSLTVIERDYDYHGRAVKFYCRCVCGTIKSIETHSIQSGNIKSCGCLRISSLSKHNTTHGESKQHKRSKEYLAWASIFERCYNPNHKSYKHYGGRGITVCEQWKSGFPEFLKNMGRCPDGHSLDRIDVDGNYEPKNCRWAGAKEQGNNKRNNRLLIDNNGDVKTLSEWADMIHMLPETISQRIKHGWSIDKSLSTPVKIRRNNAIK